MLKKITALFAKKNTQPIVNEQEWKRLQGQITYLQQLEEEPLNKLRSLVDALLSNKNWQIEQAPQREKALFVAAQVVIPVLNLGLDWVSGWKSVVVSAGQAKMPKHALVINEPVLTLPENSQVIPQVCYQILQLNPDSHSIPPLHSGISAVAWQQAFTEAYNDFCERVQTSPGNEILFELQAANSQADFFAIISKSFFYMPDTVRCAYPDVYQLLVRFYRQNPALLQNINIQNPYGALYEY